jgi:alpha-tubulin suppressor-like RCC1 family protein
VPGLATAKALGAADRVTCVARVDGTASCWGKNDAGQLGDGTNTDAFVPVQVKGPGGVGVLTGVVDVAPGVRHVCALRDDATVWCWGNNDRGQLGDGTTTSSPYPVKVVGLPP